jgi:phosphatidyl-myo-inositol alpha-mannosyltransferase
VKIMMVSEFAYPTLGGVSEHVHFLSRELARMGHDVTVLTGHLGDTEQYDAGLEEAAGYRVLRVGRSVPVVSNGSISRLSVGVGLKRRVARAIRGADVVHAQGLAPPTLPLFALRSTSAPVTVGTFHTYFDGGHWAYRVFFKYVRTALDALDRSVAVSDACVEALHPYFPGPYEIVPNGIDCELFHPLDNNEARPAGPPRILFVGRFDPRNALGTLLDAAAQLRDEGRDFLVQVVGDGPTRSIYERQARRLGLWDRIEWHGLVLEGRPTLYREASVFACPCTLASFGVVLLESLASGTPVVCADNIGFRQVIRDGMPGRFVKPHDAADLARGIAATLDSPDAYGAEATLGRALAVERYSWPTVARRIESLYLEVLTEKGLAPTSAPLLPTR